VGKHTVGNKEYPTAIYSRKKETSNIKKVIVTELEGLKADSIKKHLYCESTYIKYLVLAFYEENETEPSLMIQAAKNELELFSDTHLEAWMKYIGVMEEPVEEEFILNNVTWVSQFDKSLFEKCTGCWGKSCCRRAAEYMLGNTNMANCTDSTIAESAPYMATSGHIITASFSNNSTTYTKDSYNSAKLNYDTAITQDVVGYVKNKLQSNRPVLIGVHYTNGSSVPPNNANRATRHFMVIVGYRKEKNGNEYFLFYDPGRTTERQSSATSPNNKLIINRQQGSIQGSYDDKTYTITEIIKTN
jgi:hypothetical protein